jgi:hypothetical protein
MTFAEVEYPKTALSGKVTSLRERRSERLRHGLRQLMPKGPTRDPGVISRSAEGYGVRTIREIIAFLEPVGSP